ncbi:Protein fluG like protein [Verticillium longisporum]|nr:Protein fluG like protein [Verticillium longisporum]
MAPAQLTGQALLARAIQNTPIIDNHAHPLLNLDAIGRYPLLSIVTEAHGDAIHASLTSLAHLRAVKQLSGILKCEPTWEAVVNAVEQKRVGDYDAWVAECLTGIESVLVDDGLDGEDNVYPYTYFDEHTTSSAKRIVRIEQIAASIINAHCPEQVSGRKTSEDIAFAFDQVVEEFDLAILRATFDTEVVGFKSVICYRTGLAIPRKPDIAAARQAFEGIFKTHTQGTGKAFTRVDHQGLNEFFVHRLAFVIRDGEAPVKKPIQFHTGLGDNDITLTSASPSHLQEFIREYPTVPIVLLHASYPYTREAGYLATVYANVYADIGEIFPFLSQDRQETAIRQILELCPWSKILWSTDGHWFPETYLLAVLQVREVFGKVFGEFVRKRHITWQEGRQLVRDVFFNNSNKLYRLGLTLRDEDEAPGQSQQTVSSDLDLLEEYLAANPTPTFLRVYWNDFTATPRMRAIPLPNVLRQLREEGVFNVGVTKASLGLLQNDLSAPGTSPVGEYRLYPDFSSLVGGPGPGHASTFGDFREPDGSAVTLCPRTLLQHLTDLASRRGLSFQLGFEVELVLLQRGSFDGQPYYSKLETDGHAWSVGRAMDSPVVAEVIEPAIATLAEQGIFIEQVHPESAPGQFEVVLPRAAPLAAVDTLIHVRNVISNAATKAGYRMTLHPKPFAMACGNAAHAHLSISSADGDKPEVYQPFYAGILRHLRAICAFTYSNPASYNRLVDGAWAGGRWVAWGTQNREVPLRKISGSHWEIKCIDGLANPYFAISAILAGGLLGVRNNEALIWGDCGVDPATLTDNDKRELNVEEMLPLSIDEALAALQKDDDIVLLIGEELVERYVNVKEAEAKFLEEMNVETRRQWIMARH